MSLSSRSARNLRVSQTPFFQSVVSPRANDPKTPIRRTPRLRIRSRCSASVPRMPSAVRLAPAVLMLLPFRQSQLTPAVLMLRTFRPLHMRIILLLPAHQDNAFPPGCRPEGCAGRHSPSRQRHFSRHAPLTAHRRIGNNPPAERWSTSRGTELYPGEAPHLRHEACAPVTGCTGFPLEGGKRPIITTFEVSRGARA